VVSEASIHPSAICAAAVLGAGTRVGPFAVIEAGAMLGDRVVIGTGAVVSAVTRLEDDVVIGARVTFTGESEVAPGAHGTQAASVGPGAILLTGVEVGRGAIVAPGTVVTRSVPPHAFVSGNPGRIVHYVDAESDQDRASGVARTPSVTPMSVSGVYVHRFAEFSDFRGSLTAGEMPAPQLPFTPRRWFLVYEVPSRELRGEHAHRKCHQFLICVAGSVTVSVDDGEHRGEVVLDRPSIGIYVPPMVWGSQFRYEPDTVLLVLASHPYAADDYIRDYEDYIRELSEQRTGSAR
jgi:serine acetyltransferase